MDDPGSVMPVVAGLAQATGAQAACAVVARHLAAVGHLLPSVYLAQGDRLRCAAAYGYWQVFDGFPFDAGVLGLTFRTRTRHLIQDVHHDPAYLEAAPGVIAEVCLPLLVDGRAVGVLNVESRTPLDEPTVALAESVARQLCERLAELEPLQETSAQQLGRHAAELALLAGSGDAAALHALVVEVAADLSGCDSAVLALDGPDGLRTVAARGLLAQGLLELSATTLERVQGWVATGLSAYTVGAERGLGFPGSSALRATGARSMVVLPLRYAPQTGVLVLADPTLGEQHTDDVAVLEAFAAQVSSNLHVVAAMRELHDRAQRDGLTGLGHHSAFQEALPLGRSGPLQLAVLYLDVDHFKGVNDDRGHAAGDALLVELAACLLAEVRDDDQVFRIGGDEFAVLARVTDAADAQRLGERLLSRAQALGTSLSVGVALARDGESDAALLARADGGLYDAKLPGRGQVYTVG